MSSTSDKAKGMANEAVGNVKQAVGKATDNDKLRAEGKVQELKGEGQQAKGEVKDAIKKGVDKALVDRFRRPGAGSRHYR